MIGCFVQNAQQRPGLETSTIYSTPNKAFHGHFHGLYLFNDKNIDYLAENARQPIFGTIAQYEVGNLVNKSIKELNFIDSNIAGN